MLVQLLANPLGVKLLEIMSKFTTKLNTIRIVCLRQVMFSLL